MILWAQNENGKPAYTLSVTFKPVPGADKRPAAGFTPSGSAGFSPLAADGDGARPPRAPAAALAVIETNGAPIRTARGGGGRGLAGTKRILKGLGLTVSILWMALTIFQAFFDVDPNQYGFKAAEVEARMQACGGSFQQRYECKEAIMLAKQRAGFVGWLEKVAVIFSPPLLLALLIGRVDSRPPRVETDYFSRTPSPISRRRVR
jgi:hypothetical protein